MIFPTLQLDTKPPEGLIPGGLSNKEISKEKTRKEAGLQSPQFPVCHSFLVSPAFVY